MKRHVVGRPIKTGVSNFMFLESKVCCYVSSSVACS